MIRLGIFFDSLTEKESEIFNLYQQNHNRILHRGQILSEIQDEILHEIIKETIHIIEKLKDKELRIDVYGYRDGHDNALKYLHYIREQKFNSALLGNIKLKA